MNLPINFEFASNTISEGKKRSEELPVFIIYSREFQIKKKKEKEQTGRTKEERNEK